jgi:hypothetical protein
MACAWACYYLAEEGGHRSVVLLGEERELVGKVIGSIASHVVFREFALVESHRLVLGIILN